MGTSSAKTPLHYFVDERKSRYKRVKSDLKKKKTLVFLWQDFYGKRQHSFQELLNESSTVLLSNPHTSYHLIFVRVVMAHCFCCACGQPTPRFQSDIYVNTSWKRKMCFLCVSSVPMGELTRGFIGFLDIVFSLTSQPPAKESIFAYKFFYSIQKNKPLLNTVDTNTSKDKQP